MKPLTRNNIAYNLRLSPHIEEVDYESGKTTYVFSSELYRRKFNDKRKEAHEHMSEVLKRRYGMEFDVVELSDAYLYSKIEKRGFLIYKDNKEVIWLNNLKFVGRTTSLMN